MFESVPLHSASPQWWLVGWVLSIGLLLTGFAITNVYYDGTDDVKKPDTDVSPEDQ
jgi:uncharacterized membrane protein (DUF485 family)